MGFRCAASEDLGEIASFGRLRPFGRGEDGTGRWAHRRKEKGSDPEGVVPKYSAHGGRAAYTIRIAR